MGRQEVFVRQIEPGLVFCPFPLKVPLAKGQKVLLL